MVEGETKIIYKKIGFRLIQNDNDTYIPYKLLDEINKGYTKSKVKAKKSGV